MPPSIGHLLNRTLTVMREQTTSDGAGGQLLAYATTGTVPARVSRSTGTPVLRADRDGADVLEDIYLDTSADVRRHDWLVDGTDRFEVLATVEPSAPGTYLKATCRRMEPARPLPPAA